MSKRVVIIDYGMGNLLSVIRAFEYLGCQPVVTDSSHGVSTAECLVLPGVGAFPNGMKELRQRGLIKAIQDYAKSGRFLIGICLGMQMLLDYSEEFGVTEGLGLIPGKVTMIPSTGEQGVLHKIPHIGWNKLLKPDDSVRWERSILEGIQPDSSVYFVHSFTAAPAALRHRLADARYNGCLISAAIQNANVSGCQFHPEKSGQVGLHIIRNFLQLESGAS